VKVLGLVPGSRSNQCVLVGIADKVKLSSKSLGRLQAALAHEAPPKHICKDSDDNFGPGEGEGSESCDEDASEVCALDTVNGNVAQVAAAGWREVAHCDDQLIARHSDFDIEHSGKFRAFVSNNS
jgi:hypothetical protein